MKRSIVVAALGTAQILAWGSSYYLPAVLADPIAQGLGLSRTAVFGLFSGALLLSAVLGPSVGRAIDNRGGRGVLAGAGALVALNPLAALADGARGRVCISPLRPVPSRHPKGEGEPVSTHGLRGSRAVGAGVIRAVFS